MMRAEFEGRQLTDDELTNFFRVIVPAASETTTRTWLNVMVCLLERPDVLDEVRENRELLPAAIDEGFRLQPATPILARGTTRDVEVRGVMIPAGAGVTLVTGSANRDENTFENPDEYDLRRTGAAVADLRFRDASVRRLEHRANRDDRGDRRVARPAAEPAPRSCRGEAGDPRPEHAQPVEFAGRLGLSRASAASVRARLLRRGSVDAISIVRSDMGAL